jgi:hypothetical protein
MDHPEEPRPHQRPGALISAVTAAGLLLGASGCSSEGYEPPTEPPITSSGEQPPDNNHSDPEIAPIESGDKIDTSIVEHAISVDICNIKPTVESVQNVYDSLFGLREKPDLSFEDLQKRADEVLADYDQARENVGFYKLPPEYAQLYDDLVKGEAPPLSTYQQVAEKFFEEHGIRAVFDWTTNQNDASTIGNYVNTFFIQSEPVTEGSSTDTEYTKGVILAAIESTADVPPAFVTKSGLKEVVFGSFLPRSGQPPVALTDEIGGRIFWNTLPSESAPGGIEIAMEEISSTGAHETVGHMLMHVCGPLVVTSAKDPAIASMTNISYSEVNMHNITTEGYSTLELIEPGTEVGFVRPLSTRDEAEDRATLSEATALGLAVELFQAIRDGAADPLEMKLAYSIARNLSAVEPEEAQRILEYYSEEFSVARVMVELHRKRDDEYNKLNAFQSSSPTASNASPEAQAIMDRMDEITELLLKIESAVKNPR